MMDFRRGEANVPAIILSSAVLILALAAAYYLIAIVPALRTVGSDDADGSASSSSASGTMMMSSSAMTDDTGMAASSSSDAMTAEEQAAYDACINAATEAHNQRWAEACEDKKRVQESAYLACVENKQDETYCTAQFGGYESIGANCDLGAGRTNTLNLQFAAAKKSCSK